MPNSPSAILLLEYDAKESIIYTGTEQLDMSKAFKPTILMRKTQPHNPAQVMALLAEITIESDLTATQIQQVWELIAKRAECFALSMSEVTPVEGAAHQLNIPRDTQFRNKVSQRLQTPLRGNSSTQSLTK